MSHTKLAHTTCCKDLRRPKTPTQLAELPYPSNRTPHSGLDNRLHNPEAGLVHFRLGAGYEKFAKRRKGWWFAIADQTPLLDGSSDGVVRGWVQRCRELDPEERAICLNACSLKLLKRPAEMGPGPDPMPCAFSWLCMVTPPHGAKGAHEGSGWVPIECLTFERPSSKHHVVQSLEHWACCIRRYASWARSMARKTTTKLTVRSIAELEHAIQSLGEGGDLSPFFREAHHGSVRSLLYAARGDRHTLSQLIGVVPACRVGNRLTDYMPRGADHKPGPTGGPGGYVNLSPNAKDTAPIAIDLFPSGHAFHRMTFERATHLVSNIYEVPKVGNARAPVGKAVWYYGYCDSLDRKPVNRRYGWLPALALKH